MSFQAPITVSDAIGRIRAHRLLLPAIQREFVWAPEKIESLFDSLLQGYPIGSFLFWEVRDTAVKRDYKFYEFLRVFRERYSTHNPEFGTAGHFDFDAVLDGQQRLTALYLGLVGTYAYKKPRVWWEDNEKVLPTRRLFLNVLESPNDEDEDGQIGRQFEFKFLTDEEAEKERGKWFRVGRILDVASAFQFNQMLRNGNYQDNEFSSLALSKLHAVVHTEKVINYYRIEGADIEHALNVFVRVNSGGEPLSLSDMLMSTAIANWTTKDARKEILGLVDEIRAKGFFIDKDLVLALLAPNLDYRNGDFHKDHLHPASSFTKKKLAAVGIADADLAFYRDSANWNSILNLRHLDGSENKSKQDTDLATWVTRESDRQKCPIDKFCVDRDLPRGSDLEFKNFRAFVDKRRKLLGDRLREILG